MKKLIAGLVVFIVASCAAGFQDVRQPVRSLHDENGRLFCSAVMLRPGLAITADHCARGSAAIQVNGPVGIVVANGNDRLDLAVLLYPTGEALCPCVRLAEREAEVDEPVYVVGYPRGIAQVLTEGRSQGIADHAEMPYGRRLVVTAPVAGGNSGGAVFVFRDGEYQLVGILVEALGHLSFAVPLADLRPFLESMNNL